MLVILPFFYGDKPQAVRLAEWIAELGGVGKHDCLLAVHKDTDSAGVIEPLRKAFRRVAEFSITDDMIVEREQHAYAANIMWKRTANHVADMNEPSDWFWLEPDAVPLQKDWLEAISTYHEKSGKAFFHCLVETPRGRSNSGCGVYPAKVRDFTDRLWELSDTSWDILLYPDFAPHTAYTNLIQDIGFIPGTQTIPTFPDAASLSILAPGALLFHRVKDSSLVDRLREKDRGSRAEIAAQILPLRKQFQDTPEVNAAFDAMEKVAPHASIVVTSAPQTMADQIRAICDGLVKIIDGKPGRKQQVQTAMRDAGLIGKAKARKARKAA
jgi:hypothetical protein